MKVEECEGKEYERIIFAGPLLGGARGGLVSVMNNIAEGFERKSRIEFCRFLDIAKGSSGEVRSMLYLAQDIEYLSKDQALHLIAEYESLSKRISSLMNKLVKK